MHPSGRGNQKWCRSEPVNTSSFNLGQFFGTHYTGHQSALQLRHGFQVCGSNWSVSRRRRAAFVMSGEGLLLSQCDFCLLSPLWLPGTGESSVPRGPPCLPAPSLPGCGYRPIEGSLLVEGYESSATAGGETRSWGKQIQSLRTTCHNMFHEQAGWLNHWVCGTYGATGHSEINTLWIMQTAWQAPRWRTGGGG